MAHKFDCLVVIGRFAPFHHEDVVTVRMALTQARKVLILIGSANSPRTVLNPFTFDERQRMIVQAFDNDARVICQPIDDYLYNEQKWLAQVQFVVHHVIGNHAKIGIVGYYKSIAWQCVDLPYDKNLSGTLLRQAYFLDNDFGDGLDEYIDKLPVFTRVFLDEFKMTPDFTILQEEYRHIQAYQQAWQSAPYTPVFVTADALVVCKGCILLIERGGDYGRGLYALAGGFLDQDETLFACALRELHEETGLRIDPNTLKLQHVFDAPRRSARGRTVTTVFYFELVDDNLPTLKAADDAARAFWLPIDMLDGRQMFEDHYSVIVKMLAL